MSTGLIDATESSNRDITAAVRVPPHPEYYFQSGDLYIIAGNTLFCVHGYFFARDSPMFNAKLNPESPDQIKEGTTDLPVVLDGITAEEFGKFLWIFYNPTYSVYDADVDTWKLILDLANQLEFKEVRNLAIRELQMKEELPLAEKMALYQNYRVDPRRSTTLGPITLLEERTTGSVAIFIVAQVPARTYLLFVAFLWTIFLLYMIKGFPFNLRIL